jgi:hypothetical protein
MEERRQGEVALPSSFFLLPPLTRPDQGETEKHMRLINRTAAVIKPRQPYIDWANSFEGAAGVVSLEEVRSNATALLIPEFDCLADGRDFLEENFALIFDNQLAAWSADSKTWPKNRDLDLFRQWFDLEVHELVYDVVEEPIEIEG